MKIPEPPNIPPKGRVSITFNWSPVPYGMDIAIRVRRLGIMTGEDVGYALCDALLVACMNYDLDPFEILEDSIEVLSYITTTLIEEDEDAD